MAHSYEISKESKQALAECFEVVLPDCRDAVGKIDTAALPILANIASMDATERGKVFALFESNDPRDKSLALTTAARKPPMPDPRIILIKSAGREVQKAIDTEPNDPHVNDLLAMARASLRDALSLVKLGEKDVRSA